MTSNIDELDFRNEYGGTAENPTFVYTALLATPGALTPVTIGTNQRPPRTQLELNSLLENFAQAVGVHPNLIKVCGTPIILVDEEYREPQPASELLVPEGAGKIIVPPGAGR